MRVQEQMKQNLARDIEFLNSPLPKIAWEIRNGEQVLVRTKDHRKIRGVEPKHLRGQILH